jgi:hypothetical protein
LTAARIRRTLFALVTSLATVAICEAGAYLLHLVITGKPFSWAGISAQRSELVGDIGANPDPPKVTLPGDFGTHVVHPFLGYVLDRDQVTEAGPHGFVLFPNRPEHRADTREPGLRIVVVGGSVAWNFVFRGGSDALIDELRRASVVDQRPISFRCLALGGFKQPQQLLALNYVLGLGERFDVVINIDGFNEVALSWWNHKHEVYPFYPRGWHQRTRVLPNLADQRSLGEIVHLRAARRRRAAQFSCAPWRYSVLANSAWLASDRALERRLATLVRRLEDANPAQRSYLSHGPTCRVDDDETLFAEIAALWLRCSLQMHQLCSAQGILYYHFLQPNQYLPGTKPLSPEELRDAVDPDHPYRFAVESGYPHLQRAGVELRRSGIAFRDLSHLFTEVPQTLYIDDCCHFNLLGNQIVAEAIAGELIGGLTATR